MKSINLFYSLFIFLVAIFVPSCGNKNEDVAKPLSQEELVKRGEYLINTTGCHDCHSPKKFGPHGPVPDPELLLSGHPADLPISEIDKSQLESWILFNHHLTAAVGPWGVSFSANITSDPSGIGSWTEEQFINSMREGWYKGLEGGRKLMPPMPWEVFKNFNDDDLKAMFAYLKTVKPIQNVPPAYMPPNEL